MTLPWPWYFTTHHPHIELIHNLYPYSLSYCSIKGQTTRYWPESLTPADKISDLWPCVGSIQGRPKRLQAEPFAITLMCSINASYIVISIIFGQIKIIPGAFSWCLLDCKAFLCSAVKHHSLRDYTGHKIWSIRHKLSHQIPNLPSYLQHQ